MNSNDSEPELPENGSNSTDERILLAPEIFVFVLFPIGLFGNFTFLFFFVRFKSMRSPFNVFLSNLSVAGILFLILAVAFTCISNKGDPILRGFCFLFAISYVSSSLFVTIVATERFLAVCLPLRYSLVANDKRRAGKICAVAWLVAIACGGLVKLAVFLFDFRKNTLLFVTGFFFVAFLTLNSVLYASVFWRLWTRPLASLHVQRRVMSKLAVTAFVVFAVNTAHVIYIIIHYFLEEKLDKTPFEMIILASNVASSTINPFVYGLMNCDLQKVSVRKLLARWCCEAKETKERSSSGQPPSRSVKKTLGSDE